MGEINLCPVNDNIIVERLEADGKTESGILLADAAKDKPQKGRVLAVGPGKRDANGVAMPLPCQAGDTILFTKYGPMEIKHEGKKLLFLNEADLLAIIR